MDTFAIVRADGKVDKVTDGESVEDVARRYGWPGDGDIVPWDDKEHKSKLQHTFDSPDDQYAEWEKVAKKEGQS